LGVEMLVLAWYPHNFFRLSFGVQDQTAKVLDRLEFSVAGLAVGGAIAIQNLRAAIEAQQAEIGLEQLLRYVPYRLLAVFFEVELRGVPDAARNSGIEALAKQKFDDVRPLYRVVRMPGNTGIAIHPVWGDYLAMNFPIVRSWALWEWLAYLQQRNPNVPALSKKLFPPVRRTPLIQQTRYWDIVMEKEKVNCIYTGRLLNGMPYALDHFLPWSFVCHDQLWNLVPVHPDANSSKGNSVPAQTYMEAFVRTQCLGLLVSHQVMEKRAWARTAEPYLADLRVPKLDDLLDCNKVESAYLSVLPRLMSLAHSTGFEAGWRYTRGMAGRLGG
jgi:hypothetical protein